MRKIYLAGAYSHHDPIVRETRFMLLNRAAGHLMLQGNIVFSPISMTHPIAMECELPLGFEFWEAQDRAFIEWCDCVVVAMTPGWDTSKGVAAELNIAKDLGKPVEYIEVPS